MSDYRNLDDPATGAAAYINVENRRDRPKIRAGHVRASTHLERRYQDFGPNFHDIFGPVMRDQRVERLVQAFSTSLRPEIDAAWVVAESIGDDLLLLLSEAFSRIRKSEGRASVMRYVGRFSRESEVAFRMGTVAVQDRAYAVRHYGCALLAYSLRGDALPIR